MSGRCGIYQCLEDIKKNDQKRVAYLPMYTCETVAAPFHKAGYTLRFYEGDEESEYILQYADLERIAEKRRENFRTLLDALPETLHGLRPVFPALTENAVPSHFCFYAEERDHFLSYLNENDIFYKVFWPVGPLVNVEGHDTVKYVYGHIVSLFCDQHCDQEYMLDLARVIAAYPG